MKSNKGISMITLVITIVSIIILLGIAYRVGSRYILESKEEERHTLVTVLSSSVERRQNDKYVNISGETMYYVGYHVSSGDFYTRLYDKFENKECIYEPGLWFILDAKKSSELGIVDAEKYLVKDLTSETEQADNKYIAVANYFTGDVELLKRLDINLDGVLGGGSECTHNNVSIATCIEDAICNDCGMVITKAWGHEFAYINGNGEKISLNGPTCTEDYKCIICGYIAQKALGHEYVQVKEGENALYHNDEGHFYRCIRYDKCQAVGGFGEHEKYYSAISGDNLWKHNIECIYVDKYGNHCDWSVSEHECTTKVRSKDTETHIRYCIECLKEQEEKHSDFKYRYIDKNEHMVYCGVCNDDLYREDHIDIVKPYGICDKCEGIIDVSKSPQIEILTTQNTVSGDGGIYWAKLRDTIRINMTTTVVLGREPTIRIQNVEIKKEDMVQSETNALNWTIDVKTSNYSFIDGVMSIEVTDLVSLWGVEGDPKYETTDRKYVKYDNTKPEFIFVPE